VPTDAHAWAEVWFASAGLVRIDPTAAVSPERIELGIRATKYLDELPLMRKRRSWLKKAYLSWDGVNNAGWNQWVLGYDDKEFDFPKNLAVRILVYKICWFDGHYWC
jgi:transglutaminase-like putative cysteine protease